jgi:hypothetical protein
MKGLIWSVVWFLVLMVIYIQILYWAGAPGWFVDLTIAGLGVLFIVTEVKGRR